MENLYGESTKSYNDDGGDRGGYRGRGRGVRGGRGRGGYRGRGGGGFSGGYGGSGGAPTVFDAHD